MQKVNYVEKAAELFLKGYNCSQAVAAAFSDVVGIPEETLLKISCSHGGGFARLRYVCGAVSGMGMIAGMVYGSAEPSAKVEIYAKTRELSDKFNSEFGSIICAELLNGIVSHNDSPVPEERTEGYYKKRTCLDCVKKAAEILEEDLKAHELL